MSSWWFGVPNWMIMFICFSTTLSSSKCCNNGIGLSFVSWRGSWNLQIYCPHVQFCGNQIVRWSHCLYSRDAAEHLCNFRILDRFNLSTAGWLLLQIFGMNSQLIWFCRERLLGGVPYWKMCSAVYVLDLYRIYMCMKFITVKKVKSSFSLYNGAYIWEWKYV